VVRKSSPIGIRLTLAVRARIRAFVTETRSEHATLQALLLLGLKTAEKNPKALDPAVKGDAINPIWDYVYRYLKKVLARNA
jgi:hypothetical protein